jgi:hypothetical protein
MLSASAPIGARVDQVLTRPRFYLRRPDGSTLKLHEPPLFGAFFRLSLLFSTRWDLETISQRLVSD